MNEITKWNDLRDCEEYKFEDGSIMTQIHDTHKVFCYRFWLKKHPRSVKNNYITISEDHYLLCELKVDDGWIDYLKTIQPTEIPVVEDVHVYKELDGGFKTEEETIKKKSWDCGNGTYWLSGRSIFTLLMNEEKVKPVGNKFIKWEAVGELDCFCVSTDTGEYKVCGVVNSNSVTLRNIIFHSLTHSDDIKLGLVDLKLSEFSRYKEMNNVVGVANTVLEAAELLRLSRECMYLRNKRNSDRNLTDFRDWKPQKPTNKISIFGREFDENHEFDVEIAGETKKMTALEILNYMQE